MDGRGGAYVFEAEHLIVFVHHRSGDLFVCDFAEDAVGHHEFSGKPPCGISAWGKEVGL